jgi:membrane-bound lytic murein transglycosylase F
VLQFSASRKQLAGARLACVIVAVGLLGTCSPVPGLLDQIRALGEFRVVTRNGPLAFYRGAGDAPDGPEYQLARVFASELGVRLTMTPVRSYAEIYAAITSGRAHVAAAGLKVPAEGVRGIAFGPAYQHVHEHVIYRRGATRPATLADIGNADLEIVADSSHAATLYAARQAIPDLVWRENSSSDTQALLEGVANGTIDYTIADSTEFALAHAAHPELRIAFDFPDSQSLAWAVSTREPRFLATVGDYFSRIGKDGGLSRILARYYGPSENLDYVGPRGFMRDMQARLPEYRKWFEEAARESGLDWRLLAAIGYQESKWDATAASPSGARGLMQLTRQSATEVHIRDPADPRESILGGARYFRQLQDRVPSHVPEPDRTWFALAGYNIGYGHIEDARVLTQKAGRDPDSWQDVREFLPLLAQEYWYTQTENGYARGWEPVRYVDNVRGYRDILEWIWGDTGVPN